MEDMIDRYSNYIEEHAEEIINKVNSQFELSKEFIRAKFLHYIKQYLKPIPEHFEWYDDGCPYDHSGELIQTGYINLNQTISEFLENEYTGDKEPTYESGWGFRYLTYGDDLSQLAMEIGETIMQNTMQQILEEAFNKTISEDLFTEIMDISHDTIYDECLAGDFFFYEVAVEFTNIGHLRLRQL